MTPEITICPTFADLTAAARQIVHAAIDEAVGEPIIGLSGGRTPQPLYEALAQDVLSGRVSASEIHWTMVDERFVQAWHPRSNFGMLRKAFFEPAAIAADHMHPMLILDSPEDSADHYAKDLQAIYGAHQVEAGRPVFDLLILGIGDDGHFASLFPNGPELQVTDRWVIPSVAPDGERRLSLSLPLLASTRRALFLVSGAAKTKVLARWRAGDRALPVAHYAPQCPIVVLADEEAAGA